MHGICGWTYELNERHHSSFERFAFFCDGAPEVRNNKIHFHETVGLGDYMCIYRERNRYKRWKAYLKLCVPTVVCHQLNGCFVNCINGCVFAGLCRNSCFFTLYRLFYIPTDCERIPSEISNILGVKNHR